MNYDIIIIGGGLLGCFTARNLAHYSWRVAVLEMEGDVCTGMTKANTAIIYPGYDPVPGTLKARLSLEAGRNFDSLCDSLGVRLRRTGSMMVSFGERGSAVLREKLEQGRKNGVEGLRLIARDEILEREPLINPDVKEALYAPQTATVNPWELGIAGAECAVENGVDFYFDCKVTSIERGYLVTTTRGQLTARAVVNCAGLFGDEISELINRPRFKLATSAADYLLLDKSAGNHVRHIIMHEPEEKNRGATLVPTVDGNLLLGPSRIKTETKTGFATTREGLDFVAETSKYVFPQLPLESTIRSFASIRPGIVMEERLHDLLIYETENPGFINLAGIRTPGLTCCDEIGRHVSELLLDILGNPGRNQDFSPEIKSKPVRFRELCFEEKAALARENPQYGQIICRCGQITEAEVRAAINRTLGASTLDGVKRRAGVQMGRCQGGFCTQRIMEILDERA